MLDKRQHANGAEAWIDATTKTDEPYNLAAGIGTIVSALTSAAAMITYTATGNMLPVYILIGVATAAIVASGVLRLVGNYKRNNEITDRMERHRKEDLELANKQQQTPTKQPDADDHKKENDQENRKENGPANNMDNGQENQKEDSQENNTPPFMSPFSQPFQLNQFSPRNEEANKSFNIESPVKQNIGSNIESPAKQNIGNEAPIDQNGKDKKTIKPDLATLFGSLAAGNKRKKVTNKTNQGLPPAEQGKGVDK